MNTMTTIVCLHCEKELGENCFFKNKSNKSGYTKVCKQCRSVQQKEYRARTKNATTKRYEKTPAGYIMRMYRNMLSRITGVQKKKRHLYVGKGIMQRSDFYLFMKHNKQFIDLFNEYEKSGYDIRLAPTPDRIDSSRGYFVDNIRIVPQYINSSEGGKFKKKS